MTCNEGSDDRWQHWWRAHFHYKMCWSPREWGRDFNNIPCLSGDVKRYLISKPVVTRYLHCYCMKFLAWDSISESHELELLLKASTELLSLNSSVTIQFLFSAFIMSSQVCYTHEAQRLDRLERAVCCHGRRQTTLGVHWPRKWGKGPILQEAQKTGFPGLPLNAWSGMSNGPRRELEPLRLKRVQNRVVLQIRMVLFEKRSMSRTSLLTNGKWRLREEECLKLTWPTITKEFYSAEKAAISQVVQFYTWNGWCSPIRYTLQVR